MSRNLEQILQPTTSTKDRRGETKAERKRKTQEQMEKRTKEDREDQIRGRRK